LHPGLAVLPQTVPEVVFKSSSEDRRSRRPQTVPQNFRRRGNVQNFGQTDFFALWVCCSSPNCPQKSSSSRLRKTEEVFVPKSSPRTSEDGVMSKILDNLNFCIMGLLFVPKLSPEVVFKSSSEDRRSLRPQTVPQNFRRRGNVQNFGQFEFLHYGFAVRPQTVPRSRLQVVFGRPKKSSSPNRPPEDENVPKPSPNRPQTVFRSPVFTCLEDKFCLLGTSSGRPPEDKNRLRPQEVPEDVLKTSSEDEDVPKTRSRPQGTSVYQPWVGR
jgi:hypothetical protein